MPAFGPCAFASHGSPAPRRVCIRALDAQGRASELLFVVHADEAAGPAQLHALPARAPASAQVEALC